MSDMVDSRTDQKLALRGAVEEFFYHEAALLDSWNLDEWLKLFTEDAHYVVPATDFVEGSGESSLVLIYDNIGRIRGRVSRLNSRRAHREFPSSRTRRLITNVRILEADGDELKVTANFCIYRIRGRVDLFVGRYIYDLVKQGETYLIRNRRAELDLETLEQHGTVSIIV